MWQQILAMVAANLLLMFRGSKSTGKLDAVADFDLGRFLGCWYVAAYIPHPFKKKLSSVSTEYSRSEDGTISVIHRGYDRKKTKWHSEESVARFKESEDSGWLVVDTHNPLDENHKIIHLKEDYTQAIVVGLTMRTLWITYHDPNVTKRDLDGLIARADALGFKTSKLIRVDQSIDWESPDFQGPSNDDSSGP